jgi:uncharacterized damage-inducible protein DinB
MLVPVEMVNDSNRTLIELLYGKGAHADASALVKDVSLGACSRTVAGFPHSIWQLIWHMNYWMDFELQRIKGGRPVYPEHAAESWPRQPSPEDGAEWEKTAARFSALIEELAGLADSGAETLNRQVEPPQANRAAIPCSVLTLLWQLVAHNSYHLGQIVLLQRAFGEWPMRHGDTW